MTFRTKHSGAVSTTGGSLPLGRLARYGAVAALGGLGAGAGTASAAIVYSGTLSSPWGPVTRSWSGSQTIDGGSAFPSFGDAQMDARFSSAAVGASNGPPVYRRAIVRAHGAGGERFVTGRLATNAVIGSGANWSTAILGRVLARSDAAGASWSPVAAGGWSLTADDTPVRGYLGFEMSDGGSGVYYGWFDISVSRNGLQRGVSKITMTIHGWAYDDTGGSILAGQTTATAVPGGAGLAALAFGAAGLRGRRRIRA